MLNAIIASVLIAMSGGAKAQSTAGSANPESAVLSYIRSEVGVGRIALDPHLIHSDGTIVARDAQRSLLLAQAVSADTATVRRVIRCASRRASSCSLAGYAAAVLLGAPQLSKDGKSATIEVHTKKAQANARTPISTESRVFAVVKAGDQWKVSSVRYTSRS